MHGNIIKTVNHHLLPFGSFKYKDDIYIAAKYKWIKEKHDWFYDFYLVTTFKRGEILPLIVVIWETDN